jgi:hypothetical protein
VKRVAEGKLLATADVTFTVNGKPADGEGRSTASAMAPGGRPTECVASPAGAEFVAARVR